MCKKSLFLISFIVVLALAGNAKAQLDPSAVDTGHVYLFEDVSGGQVPDDSANSHSLTIVGDPQVVGSPRGKALQFDGVDDGIDVPDSDFINVNAGPWPNRTVVAVFKCDDVDKPGKQTVFEEGGTTRGITIYVSEGLVYGAAWNRAEYNWDGAWLSAPIESGNWYGVAVVIRDGAEAVDDDKFEMWVNGQLVAKAPGGQMHNHGNDGGIGYTNENNVFHDGNASPADGHYFEGAIDEVWILNAALNQAEISEFAGQVWPFAFGPDPADGAMLENTWANLAWSPGGFAVSHDVYFGTSLEDVNNGVEGTFIGSTTSTEQIVGFPGFPRPEGLVPGTTYYWRVDEVNDANAASPWKGEVWSFWIPPKTAYRAEPADGLEFIPTDVTLSWTGGFGAKLHNVYFGDSFEDVNNAVGAPPTPELTFTPEPLEPGKTYYWRVDEFDGAATNKGDVWSFTTVPEVEVTNPNLLLWWKLDEGKGGTAVDWSGHGNHGTIFGDAQWTDGYQGMALTFGSDVYVESVGYDGPTGASPRTCCAWIRSTVTGNHNIMSWGQNVTGQKWRMRVEGDVGVLRVEVNGGYHYGVTSIADGQWHHVAVTFEDDGTPDVLDTLLYVDGQLDATSTSQATAIDTAAGPVRIGESPWHNAPFEDQIDDARVYDVVLTAEEIQQVMLGDTKLAGNPEPPAYATVDIRDVSSLSWSPGDTAASHDVYFGAERDAVANSTTDSPGFQGNQSGLSLPVADMVEFGGGDYYWRIDEVEAGGTVHAGTIWNFTVPDYLIVDDIESYNDLPEDVPESNRVYLSWVDGFGTTTNGAVVGNLDVPLTERSNVHGGFQAMPYSYDNNLKTSEATLTLTKRDWTAYGVTKLSLWFRGDAANAPERMYVALNGNAVVYHEDTAVTQTAAWTEWVIDLVEFGVDLTDVNTITIGFGTKNSPAAGGTGTMYFDDIRLIR
jgi:hypothetical protein